MKRSRKRSEIGPISEESADGVAPTRSGSSKRQTISTYSTDDDFFDDSRSEDRSAEESSQRGEGDLDEELDVDDFRRHDEIIEDDDTATVTVPPMTLKRVVRAVDGSMVSLEDILDKTKLTLVVMLRHFG